MYAGASHPVDEGERAARPRARIRAGVERHRRPRADRIRRRRLQVRDRQGSRPGTAPVSIPASITTGRRRSIPTTCWVRPIVNMRAFFARGGKLMLYHGWSDRAGDAVQHHRLLPEGRRVAGRRRRRHVDSALHGPGHESLRRRSRHRHRSTGWARSRSGSRPARRRSASRPGTRPAAPSTARGRSVPSGRWRGGTAPAARTNRPTSPASPPRWNPRASICVRYWTLSIGHCALSLLERERSDRWESWTSSKGELLEIIEWTDDSRDTLSWRFPDEDKAIKNGAQLIVRESQVAQFVYLGEFGDTFKPGKHSLTPTTSRSSRRSSRGRSASTRRSRPTSTSSSRGSSPATSGARRTR